MREDIFDEFINTKIGDRVKIDKRKSDEAIEALNELKGVEARQITTDEFDIPPTAVIRVRVELTELD